MSLVFTHRGKTFNYDQKTLSYLKDQFGVDILEDVSKAIDNLIEQGVIFSRVSYSINEDNGKITTKVTPQ